MRCRTVAGQWQEETTATPYPHGVRGIPAVTVHVGGPAGPAIPRLAGEAVTRLSWAAHSVAAWRRRGPGVPSYGEGEMGSLCH